MIWQQDILKESLSLALDDIRKNLWLIDDILSDFVTNPYLKDKYGQKQVDACKEWFVNNAIEVNIGYKGDRMKTPCVTIMLDPQNENSEYKTMADQSPESTILLPNKIGKPIPYVVKPFVPTGYDDSTGEVSIDESIDLRGVSPGMLLVNPANGTGYVIDSISGNGLFIEPNQEIAASQFGILPQYQYYKARVEHIWMNTSYTIACTTQGDPSTTLWLHSIVFYAFLRYKESLLEALGLSETVFNVGPLAINQDLSSDVELAWDRTIQISGVSEQTFIKSPRRFVESIVLKEKVKDTCDTFIGGIKILSNFDTQFDKTNELWTTIDDDVGDPDETDE